MAWIILGCWIALHAALLVLCVRFGVDDFRELSKDFRRSPWFTIRVENKPAENEDRVAQLERRMDLNAL